MTLEKTTYTDSGITDEFKKFFNSFKEDNEYVYVNLIDSVIGSSNPIEINYDDFNEVLKQIISDNKKHRIHETLYRAIKEVLQTKIHSSVDGLVKDNLIKFTLVNLEGYDEIFDFPKEVDELDGVNPDTICALNLPVQETVTRIMLYLIKKEKIINRNELIEKCSNIIFLKRRDIGKIPPKDLNFVLDSKQVFTEMKNIAYELGFTGTPILLEKKQNTEVAFWLLGRYAIKRIDLTGDVLFFNDQYYQNNAEVLIRRKARECLVNSSNGDMGEIWNYVKDISKIISFEDIMKYSHITVLLNGTYNIKTGEFIDEFSKDNIVLQQIPHNYNPSTKYDEIDKVVNQIVSDKKDKQMLYDAISLCFHPYNGVNMQYGGVGIAGSGKNQLVDLIRLSLGSDNVSGARIQDIATDATTQKDCAFKMANVDADMSDASVQQPDTIKKWTTQDPMSGRGIYERMTTYRASSRLFFFANELYEMSNSDDATAMYDRTYLAKLNNRVRHTDKEVKNIMQKTASKDELEGFVFYLLQNATWIAKHEKTHYSINPQDTKNTWNLFGNRIQMFYEKYFVVSASDKTESRVVFDKWLHHALENNFQVKDKKKFYEVFDEIVGTYSMKTRIDNEQVYAYSGFRLKSNEELKNETQTKLEQTSFKCDKCDTTYNTVEPLEKLRRFHKESFPNHLIIEVI
ncbi:MAG: hypothetical protein ISR79_02610 [Nitrosopumilus sp.]|nr:hypothetical protein [Nitrosopumilus sp.]